MAFSSLTFLFVFLPIFFGIYYSIPARMKNGWALLASGAFYSWGAPTFLPVVLLTSLLDYRLSLIIASHDTGERRRRALLALSIVVNVAILAYFKYSNFFFDQLNELLSVFGLRTLSWELVALPIGISFITFEKISYMTDVYRRRVAAAPTFATYLLFLALFPHLIAGPIFRYHDLSEQLLSRRLSLAKLQSGIERFTLGLAKKLLIADQLAAVADTIFALPSGDLSTGYAWLGACAYAFQIYFDFSGYSDMAIGLGRLMGFEFLENFNRPYTSQSITEFWRRWHISLSNWMKEYLYIPLGGNRLSTLRTYVNLWTVFLVSGIWHGANWTFLIWGAYHGLFLVLERIFAGAGRRFPGPFRTTATFLVLLVSWVLFRSPSVSEAAAYLGSMFGPLIGKAPVQGPLLAEVVTHRQWTAFAIAALCSFAPVPRSFRAAAHRFAPTPTRAALGGAFAIFALYLSTLSAVNSQFHPFIYFRF